jgi:hypothetical protein
MLKAFMGTHQSLVEEMEDMIYKFIDPINFLATRRKLDSEARLGHHNPPPRPGVYTDTEEEDTEPETPVFQPCHTYNSSVDPTKPVQYSNQAEWEIPEASRPIGNSKEWEMELYAGRISDTIQFESGDDYSTRYMVAPQ